MKKTLVVLLAIVSVFCTLCLTACGGSDADVAGTYKFQSMTADGETYTVGDELYPGMSITDTFMVLELKKDKTFTLASMGENSTGTWAKDGKNVVLTLDGGEGEDAAQTFKLDGDKLTMEDEEEGMKIVLKK